MSKQVDLNALRDTIIASQKRKEDLPTATERKIMVDPNGKIQSGNNTGNKKRLSEVHQGTFAVTRTAKEQMIVKEKFPRNTQLFEVNGVKGWYYTFQDEFNQKYEMFAYFDGTAYQVKVVFPAVEGKYKSIHDCHLFRDGRICFGLQYAGGLTSLENAFAKSVLWANGFTIYVRTGQYPFSKNNLSNF
jgi:hypothetical protein